MIALARRGATAVVPPRARWRSRAGAARACARQGTGTPERAPRARLLAAPSGGEPLGHFTRAGVGEPHAPTGTLGRSPARPRACSAIVETTPTWCSISNGVAVACAHPTVGASSPASTSRATSGNGALTSPIVSTPPGRSTRNARRRTSGGRERNAPITVTPSNDSGRTASGWRRRSRASHLRRRGARARRAVATA